jgi:dTMP kinase
MIWPDDYLTKPLLMFITFEGPDGSGKSTQARQLAEYLQSRGEDVLLTREPGGTAIGDQIRNILHSHDNAAMAATTEFFLYNAARAQIVAEVIRPALAAGKVVLSDRFADSTVAYQGYGRQLDLNLVHRITDLATAGLKPDLTFFIDISVEEGLRRRKDGHAHGAEWNRMDSQSREFYERARRGYEELIRAEPARWVCVNGAKSVDTVQAELRKAVDLALEQFRQTTTA